MNILGLISQLIGIKTLRLTETFWEEGNFSYNVQLLDRQELLDQARILIGKCPLSIGNTPTAFVRGTASREPKLDSVRTRNLKGSATFPTTPRLPKSDIRSYVYRMRENRLMK